MSLTQLCDALIPDISATLRNVTLWRDYFLRWSAKAACPSTAIYDLYPRRVPETATLGAVTVLPGTRRTFKPFFRRSTLFNTVSAYSGFHAGFCAFGVPSAVPAKSL